jgi:hypothetical protein
MITLIIVNMTWSRLSENKAEKVVIVGLAFVDAIVGFILIDTGTHQIK